jgi:hypothetical protein
MKSLTGLEGPAPVAVSRLQGLEVVAGPTVLQGLADVAGPTVLQGLEVIAGPALLQGLAVHTPECGDTAGRMGLKSMGLKSRGKRWEPEGAALRANLNMLPLRERKCFGKSGDWGIAPVAGPTGESLDNNEVKSSLRLAALLHFLGCQNSKSWLSAAQNSSTNDGSAIRRYPSQS